MNKTVDLHQLKRSELQRLAKANGIKANLKNSKLIEALEACYNEAKSQTLSNVHNKNLPASPSIKNNLSTTSDSSIEGFISLDSVSPIWNHLSPTGLSNLTPVKSPTPPRRPRSRNKATVERTVRTRSSSRSKKGDSSTYKTPTTTSEVKNDGKTFSIPKKRSQKRVTSDAKTPIVKKAEKRKSSVFQNSTSKAKRSKLAADEHKRSSVGKALPKSTSKNSVTKNREITSASKLFAKAHEKTFSNMESIDVYQKRKEERAKKLFGSSKKQDTLSRLAKPKTPVVAKPVSRPKPSFMSPLNKGAQPAEKKPALKTTVFKPTVLSTSNMNTNFTKTSRLVTPKKVVVSFAKSPPKNPPTSMRTPAQSKRTSVSHRKSLTPFRPNTSTNTPQSTKKKEFNLQESLKKPLTWIPHKGPLKKFEDSADKPTFKDRVKNYKNPPKTTTREKRRQEMKTSRSAAKSIILMKKRGMK